MIYLISTSRPRRGGIIRRPGATASRSAVLALWLIGFGYFASPHPLPPALQNDMLSGLLLVMLAIIPNKSNLPPDAWLKFYAERQERVN